MRAFLASRELFSADPDKLYLFTVLILINNLIVSVADKEIKCRVSEFFFRLKPFENIFLRVDFPVLSALVVGLYRILNASLCRIRGLRALCPPFFDSLCSFVVNTVYRLYDSFAGIFIAFAELFIISENIYKLIDEIKQYLGNVSPVADDLVKSLSVRLCQSFADIFRDDLLFRGLSVYLDVAFCVFFADSSSHILRRITVGEDAPILPIGSAFFPAGAP